MTNPNDVSKDRVITGARAILELMYAISSTSYDIALLDSLPIVRAPIPSIPLSLSSLLVIVRVITHLFYRTAVVELLRPSVGESAQDGRRHGRL